MPSMGILIRAPGGNGTEGIFFFFSFFLCSLVRVTVVFLSPCCFGGNVCSDFLNMRMEIS